MYIRTLHNLSNYFSTETDSQHRFDLAKLQGSQRGYQVELLASTFNKDKHKAANPSFLNT